MLTAIKGGITAPKGFKAAGVKAGIKKSGKEDLTVIYSPAPCSAAALFTTNSFAAAGVQVSREVAAKGTAQAIVVNSGCANSCTGEQGMEDARGMAHLTASLLGLADDQVFVASTGIIGVNLPMAKVADGIKRAVAGLSADGHEKALQGIMTTDTFPKVSAYEFTLGGVTARVAGIAKGAGMIHPNMATLLSFVTTDAAVSPALLKQALKEAVNVSMNSITVDGDMSTNDTICVLANGQAGNKPIEAAGDPAYGELVAALTAVCTDLAKLIVRDGEGATKFLEITVKGAVSYDEAKAAAMSVARSPLVKTAFFGQDPNWGRILCAVGYSGATVEPAKSKLTLGGIIVAENGMNAAVSDAKALQKVMAEKDIVVEIELGTGDASATVWTCDFSYEYVKINADYST
ncbi:bifunctional glutamate N-acetyltransferase/amino-acid acetyltransferase ArgJ [Anaeroselena agilis]|uniref:Arginine biosynthesis bifunctional protein ArgJ n=1 Tax=Anaeroselena agilis TaxID=3063788 RepID=A0ABU3P291_9FIRM|nr:bifunctional glutamate N-acetyltransferase/amino-acid acetyltransferase ArgJ [Selenomonadales bacterium 4137-cl]